MPAARKEATAKGPIQVQDWLVGMPAQEEVYVPMLPYSAIDFRTLAYVKKKKKSHFVISDEDYEPADCQ